MRGDTLASGGIKATFQPPKVSLKRWEEIFPPEKRKRKAKKIKKVKT